MTLPNGGITAMAASSRLAGAVPASAAPATTRLTVSPALKSVLPSLPVTVLAAAFEVVFVFVAALVSSRGPDGDDVPGQQSAQPRGGRRAGDSGREVGDGAAAGDDGHQDRAGRQGAAGFARPQVAGRRVPDENRVDGVPDRRGKQHLRGGPGQGRGAEQREPAAALAGGGQQQSVAVGPRTRDGHWDSCGFYEVMVRRRQET